MGNNNSTQGKYVLPHGCANPQQDASSAGENDTGQSSRKKSTSAEKQSAGGCKGKTKSRLLQTFSLSSPGKSGKSKKAGRDCFDTPSKSKQQAQRHSSVPLTESTPKKTVKSNISAGSKVVLSSQKHSSSVDKFAEMLAKISAAVGESPNTGPAIKRDVFIKNMTPQSPIASKYMWPYFCNYQDLETITEVTFVHYAEQFYTPITDKAQVNFYVKIFGKGTETVTRAAFTDFLLSAYQLSGSANESFTALADGSDPFDGKDWIESVVKSCFHVKDEMSLVFLSNWILTNLPRILIPMHKYILHQLTTGYATLASANSSEAQNASALSPVAGMSIMDQYRLLKESRLLAQEANVLDTTDASPSSSHNLNPILLWLMSLCLPLPYVAVLETKKPDPLRPDSVSPTQLLQWAQIGNPHDSNKWTMLYHSDEHGLSVNRIQYHIFNYRGPTLMFIKAENDYTFCVALDMEWKESCHFWGGEDAMLLQLLPEFRIVEKGTKIMYMNFSIRGYPFGIQVGKDPRDVSIDIKPDFEYINFKKIPCRILNIVVWGCAPPKEKKAQVEHKKWEAKECEKQRKINLNNVDWNDNPDKYLLELGGAYKSYGNKQ